MGDLKDKSPDGDRNPKADTLAAINLARDFEGLSFREAFYAHKIDVAVASLCSDVKARLELKEIPDQKLVVKIARYVKFVSNIMLDHIVDDFQLDTNFDLKNFCDEIDALSELDREAFINPHSVERISKESGSEGVAKYIRDVGAKMSLVKTPQAIDEDRRLVLRPNYVNLVCDVICLLDEYRKNPEVAPQAGPNGTVFQAACQVLIATVITNLNEKIFTDKDAKESSLKDLFTDKVDLEELKAELLTFLRGQKFEERKMSEIFPDDRNLGVDLDMPRVNDWLRTYRRAQRDEILERIGTQLQIATTYVESKKDSCPDFQSLIADLDLMIGEFTDKQVLDSSFESAKAQTEPRRSKDLLELEEIKLKGEALLYVKQTILSHKDEFWT